MEGMISKVAVETQQAHYNLYRVKKSAGWWVQGLLSNQVWKPLISRQGMYHKVQVHDTNQGGRGPSRRKNCAVQ